MLRLSDLIKRDAEALAQMESEDVGKPLTLARSDVQVCARLFRILWRGSGQAAWRYHPVPEWLYYPHGLRTARRGGRDRSMELPVTDDRALGRAGLGGGNAVVLKPAEDTSLTALALAKLMDEVGFPKGAFNVVTGLGEEAGAALSAHPGTRISVSPAPRRSAG